MNFGLIVICLGLSNFTSDEVLIPYTSLVDLCSKNMMDAVLCESYIALLNLIDKIASKIRIKSLFAHGMG